MGSETVLSQLYHATRITFILWCVASRMRVLTGNFGTQTCCVSLLCDSDFVENRQQRLANVAD